MTTLGFPEIISNAGLSLKEPGSKYYDSHVLNQNLLSAILKINASRNELISGFYNESEGKIQGVKISFFINDNYQEISFPDVTVNIVEQHQFYCADQSTGTIIAVDIPDNFTGFNLADNQFPLLFCGYYQNTGATKSPFGRWIAKQIFDPILRKYSCRIGTTHDLAGRRATCTIDTVPELKVDDKVIILSGEHELTKNITFPCSVFSENDDSVIKFLEGNKLILSGSNKKYFLNLKDFTETTVDISGDSSLVEITGENVSRRLVNYTGNSSKIELVGIYNNSSIPMNGTMDIDGAWIDGDIPGWLICSKANFDKGLTPNLENTFIKHANVAGETGGANEIKLTPAQLPPHDHAMNHDHGSLAIRTGDDSPDHTHRIYGHYVNISTQTGSGHYSIGDYNANSGGTSTRHQHSAVVDLPEYEGQTLQTGEGEKINIEPNFYTMIKVKRVT